MCAVVENGLMGGEQFSVSAEGFGTIRIAIKAGEITARDFEPDAMAGFEQVARDPKVNLEALRPARLEECGLVQAVAVARAQNAFAQIVSVPVLMHVHELAGEIRVAGAGSRPQD